MIEKIAAVEGGLEEETTYDGRKLRWSEDARKGLWTMKNAYQRRRVKARVEKRARMKKLDAITLDFARQVIEEETGAPLDIQSAAASASARPAEPGRSAPGEAKLVARDDKKNPLISTFEWTDDATQRILRVPAGSCGTRRRSGSRSWRGSARRWRAIDLALVEDGIEIGKQMMAEMIATYPTAGKGAAAAAPDPAAPRSARSRKRSRYCGSPEQSSSGPGRQRERLPQRGELADRASKSGDRSRALIASTRTRSMSSYRFCRTDDIGLLVDALNRCWSPYFPDEPAVTPAAFKRSIRDLQVWCSSCMVAFSGSDPIGVLIGAKRPSGTLIHKIAVHPDHRRQGHGRHLLTSLSSKLAILGPPRMVAEVPETFAATCGLFSACGYVQEAVLTDYVLRAATRASDGDAARGEGFVIPVTVDDLAANGLLGEASSAGLLGALGRDADRKEGRHRRTRRRLRRANRGLPPLCEGERSGDCVAPLVHRGRWRPSEATALSTPRARHGDLPVPEGPPGGDLGGAPGDARFPPRRRASTLRSEGAVRVGLTVCSRGGSPRERVRPQLELITLLVVPLPPSMWNGARVLTVAQSPRPFQPPFGSSMRPSIHFV